MVWGEVVDGVREEEGVEDEKVDRAWGLGIGTGQGLRRESGQFKDWGEKVDKDWGEKVDKDWGEKVDKDWGEKVDKD